MLAVCEVADLDVRLSAGQAEAVLGDVDRHLPTDDVAPGAQPRTLLELQAQPNRLRQRAVNTARRGSWARARSCARSTAGHERPNGAAKIRGWRAGPQADRRRAGPPGGPRRAPRPAPSPRRCRAAGTRAASAGRRRAPPPRADRRSGTGRRTRRSRRVPGPGRGNAARARSCRSIGAPLKRRTDATRQAASAEQRIESREAGRHDLVAAGVVRGRLVEGSSAAGNAQADLDRGTAPARFEPGESRAERGFRGHLPMIEQMF